MTIKSSDLSNFSFKNVVLRVIRYQKKGLKHISNSKLGLSLLPAGQNRVIRCSYSSLTHIESLLWVGSTQLASITLGATNYNSICSSLRCDAIASRGRQRYLMVNLPFDKLISGLGLTAHGPDLLYLKLRIHCISSLLLIDLSRPPNDVFLGTLRILRYNLYISLLGLLMFA